MSKNAFWKVSAISLGLVVVTMLATTVRAVEKCNILDPYWEQCEKRNLEESDRLSKPLAPLELKPNERSMTVIPDRGVQRQQGCNCYLDNNCHCLFGNKCVFNPVTKISLCCAEDNVPCAGLTRTWCCQAGARCSGGNEGEGLCFFRSGPRIIE